MKQKGIWLRKGLALYHLAPSELALALLVRDSRVLNGMAGGTAPGLLRVGVEILALLGIMVLQYLFPSLARFEASLADTLKNACMMALAILEML